MSSFSPLVFAQRCLTRYGMTTYLTLGNIGLLGNIITFSQRTHRRNPFSLYILAASICSLIGLNVAVIPNIYALDYTNSFTAVLVYCRVQFYVRHSVNQMMRTFIVIACADRYATCSNQVHIRAFSQYRRTIRIIPSVIVFWLVVSIYPTMVNSIVNGTCDISNRLLSIIYSIYLITVLGIFPLAGMITFEILIMINLKNLRTRIRPIGRKDSTSNVLRKRDRDMIKMLFIELSVYICTTIPVIFVIIYKTITDEEVKIFYENLPGIVKYIYFQVSDGGKSATIGVQKSGSGLNMTYSVNVANSVTNGMTLTFDTNTNTYSNGIL